jgi:hypothetical protein
MICHVLLKLVVDAVAGERVARPRGHHLAEVRVDAMGGARSSAAASRLLPFMGRHSANAPDSTCHSVRDFGLCCGKARVRPHTHSARSTRRCVGSDVISTFGAAAEARPYLLVGR